MKHLDNFSKRVLTISASVMGIILCATLFVATVSPSYAENNNNPKPQMPQPGTCGNILMDYTAVHVPSQDKTYYECMVWDSQTGKSKLYYYSFNEKKFIPYENNVQLPANPLD